MANLTIAIDTDTRDIIIADGTIKTTSDNEAILQNIRNTLLVYRGEFEKEADHGTAYASIFENGNISNEEIVEIIRDAIFQESYVQEISDITVTRANRQLTVNFEAVLYTGDNITARVVI